MTLFRLSPIHFVERVVLSRGKVIMKLSHCQQPYWIDGLKTERTLCLNLSKPVGLRSDGGVCPRQKYPLALSMCLFTWVYVLQKNSLCGSCVFAHIHALLAKTLTLRSLRKCSRLFPLSNKNICSANCHLSVYRVGPFTSEIRFDFFCIVSTRFVDNSKFLALLSLHSKNSSPNLLMYVVSPNWTLRTSHRCVHLYSCKLACH